MFKAAKVEGYERLNDDAGAGSVRARLRGIRSQPPFPATTSKSPSSTAITSPHDTGTGFVHTAPSHGRDDFDIWMAHGRWLAERGIDTRIPYTVDADGFFTEEAPGFEGRRVIDDKGNKGDANEAVIKALIEAGNLVSRGRLKHQYPHSWRSKKPVIFRNTPQWFIALDKPIGVRWGDAARDRAAEIAVTQMVSARGREPHHRHDRQSPRLGGLAPARLGRADRRLRQ